MFDPYYKWLGILPKDQPPNHYRLLGVELFEGDLDVLEGAADRQMGFVRQYQSGEYAAQAAKLLNELAVARMCLLKPATKSAYDAKLRQDMAPPVEDLPDLSFPTELPIARQSKRARKAKRKNNSQMLVLGGGLAAAGVLIILLIVFASGRSRPPGDRSVATNDSSRTVLNAAAMNSTGPGVDTPKPTGADSKPTKTATETPVASVQPSIEPKQSLPVSPANSPPVSPGDWIDLVQWSEGVDWAQRGPTNWNDKIIGNPSKSGIAIKREPFAHFPLAAMIDGEYELDLQFTRTNGNLPVCIQFPIGVHTMRLLLGDEDGAVSQVSFVNGKPGPEHRPGQISNDQMHQLQIRVRQEAEWAAFTIDLDNDKGYIQWEGDASELTDVDETLWATSANRHVWIGASDCSVMFHKVQVRSLSGSIRRDAITAADRQKDLSDGFVRLIGEVPRSKVANNGWFSINQMIGSALMADVRWPRVTPEFKLCDDYYGAHALSRIQCKVPKGAKSFSVVGCNFSSGTSSYQVVFDGRQVYDSHMTPLAVIKVDIPPAASGMELVCNPLGDSSYDHTYWCYPRFHEIAAAQLTDRMLDQPPGPLNTGIVFNQVGGGPVVHNQPIHTAPVHFRDAVLCDEFMFAHAPSTIMYSIPEGMTRFTAVGFCMISQSVKFQVNVDSKRIYESPTAGLAPIDVTFPPGAKIIALTIDDMFDAGADHSFWCYPRLHRK